MFAKAQRTCPILTSGCFVKTIIYNENKNMVAAISSVCLIKQMSRVFQMEIHNQLLNLELGKQ